MDLHRDWAVLAPVANNFPFINDKQMWHNSLILEKGNWNAEKFND